VITIHQLVAIANVFFLCNALLGIMASFQIFASRKMKAICVVLFVCFITILLFSSIWILAAIVVITCTFIYFQYRDNKQKANNKLILRKEV
jgi:amino acid efflux transporter